MIRTLGGLRGTRARKSTEPCGQGCTHHGTEPGGGALESSPSSGGGGSVALPGLCHTWQAAAGRRRLQRATWLRSPLGGQRRCRAALEQAEAAPEINLQVRVLPVGHGASPASLHPRWAGVPILAQPLPRGSLCRTSFPRRSRERPEGQAPLLPTEEGTGWKTLPERPGIPRQ